MGVSSIRVTEGSGPYLHTWQRSISSVNREDQYVQLGEPAFSTTYVMAEDVSVATSGDHLIQIMAGSSLYVRVHRIIVSQRDPASALGPGTIRLIRLSTAGTTGTTINVVPADTADTPGLTALSLPSSKGTEVAYPWSESLVFRASASAMPPARMEWVAESRGKPFIIPAGTSNGLAVAILTGVTGATVDICAVCTETAWL